MSTRQILCQLDPAKYGWTACGGIQSILEPHEMARRTEAKEKFLKQQKEEDAAARRAAYAAKKASSSELADNDGEVGNNPNSSGLQLLTDTALKYYTITDTPVEEKEKPAAAAEEGGDTDMINSTHSSITTNDKTKDKPLKQIAIHATKTITNEEDGATTSNLDIFTYHRGRVGQEPRESKTGELLCDTDPIDTNHGLFNGPRSYTCKVTVKFPLGDLNEEEYVDSDLEEDERDKKDFGEDGAKMEEGGEINETKMSEPTTTLGDGFEDKGGLTSFNSGNVGSTSFNSGVGGRVSRNRTSKSTSFGASDIGDGKAGGASVASKLPHFVEVVQWDLADPKTPSPEEYAANIASEFGLTFPQTMDLKESIERQLNSFCRSQPSFFAPIKILDPYGTERPNAHFGPPETHCGPVNNYKAVTGGGGARPTIKRSGSSAGASRRSAGSERPRGTVKPNPRGGIHIVPQNQVQQANEKKNNYQTEILKRIKAASSAEVAECVAHGKATLDLQKNEVCHICHNRKETVLTFHCGRHSFCDYHCATRLSFRAQEYDPKKPLDIPINYCPVCTLNCTCAKCIRRLENVAKKMKSDCQQQNVGVEDVVMDNLFELCSAKNLRPGTLEPTNSPDRAANSKKKGSSKKKGNADGGGSKQGGTKRGRSFDEDGNASGGYVPRLSTSRSREGPEFGFDEAPKKKRKLDPVAPRKHVLKILPLELPNEMLGGQITNPVTSPEDLATIFTPDGFFPAPDDDSTAAVDSQKYQDRIELIVEGNFYLCAVCGQEVKDRVCCKKCPRTYHKKCLEETFGSNACKNCEYDQQIRPDDEVHVGVVEIGKSPGKENEKIQNAFAKHKEGTPSFHFMSMILVELLQILQKLTLYDYGDIFSCPVNTKEITDYLEVVSKPMDYSTIISKMERGEYSPSSPQSKGSDGMEEMDVMEEIVFNVLTDIGQVHHNCTVYNPKDGMFYRAGKVQAMKWKAYYTKYLKDRVPDSVQSSLAKFEKSCETEQATIFRSRHFEGTKSATARAVAVFDPDTMRIVKQYSSKAAAKTAVLLLHDAGYECEWELTTSNTKTKLEHAKDPEKTIFGYQWIPTDELKGGDFKVREKSQHDAEVVSTPVNFAIMKTDTLSGTRQGFNSELAAYEDFLKEKIASLANRLNGGEDGEETQANFVTNYVDGEMSISGITWKRVKQSPGEDKSEEG